MAGKASLLHCWAVLQAPSQLLIPLRHACHTAWVDGVLHAGEMGKVRKGSLLQHLPKPANKEEESL